MPPVAILAGGFATRLRPITETIPKAMIDIAGRPFISYQMELLKRKGIERVVLCTGYLGKQIQDFLKDGSPFGITVTYSFDGDKLLGTGGALRKALPLLGDTFWVMYGDSYLDVDLKPILDYYTSHDEKGLMTVLRNDNHWDRSNVVYNHGRIIRYDKQNITPDMHYIDYGLALLKKEAFDDFLEKEVFDLAELYGNLVVKGEMLGYEVTKRFYEIGSHKGLEETRKHLAMLNEDSN
ncbi:MAG: nucleotidyltransferase family protein [Nitrospirae bacterium]|nr:nucleotidyltransferase family protein [Nitrospirota bacterium]MCL5237569.1 nucleotidyltransferase family protein [Nitrospirota bacterium]